MSSSSDKSAGAFRTISEVATDLGLATHVLRFWESKFPQIKPLKRAGGRRYYRPDDVALLKRLQVLLHDEGYTIKGVQKLFREEGTRKFKDEGIALSSEEEEAVLIPAKQVSQGSLFDAPAPTSSPSLNLEPEPEEDFMEEAEKYEDTTSSFEDEGPTAIEPEPFRYSPDLLPSAPEPEEIEPVEIYHQTPAPVQITGLSENQRNALEEILQELKAMKEKIDQVA